MNDTSAWVRIPAHLEAEADRRTLAGILAAAGLEVRLVKDRATKGGSWKRYLEYRSRNGE